MAKSTGNNLKKARKAKNDEFYTQLADIEKELQHYTGYFKNKIVFLNCDDPECSNFWKYFRLNFAHLGLKKLISTHYETDKPSYKLEMNGPNNIVQTLLKQNGDFRSPECVEILKETDIVVTNPPFSLFREYIAQLIEYKKKFLVLGNQNAITYKEIFGLIKENKIWSGVSLDGRNIWYRIPDYYEKFHKIENGIKYAFVASTIWWTNLKHKKRNEELILYKKYNSKEYPKYDNYNAIEVSKVKEIPEDYEGVMGVPITFLHKYNPNQFEIVGNSNVRGEREHLMNNTKCATECTYVNGKPQFARLLIKRKTKK